MNDMPTVNELDDALKYVREDHYAFITDYSLLDYINYMYIYIHWYY
jgi:hypothetical protein